MDEIDRRIVNSLQDGIDTTERPFAQPARALDLGEDELLERLKTLLEHGVLTRFGPMFDAAAMGGAFCLCAMAVPGEEIDEVADAVNAFHQVAHNYERDHRLSMWFVLATESEAEIDHTIAAIEGATGYEVLAFPKLDEFFVGLRLEA